MILGKNLSKLIFGSTEIAKVASTEFNPSEANRISLGLDKVASLPYSSETYSSLIGMIKIASNCINSMSGELEAAKGKVEDFEKKASVRIIMDDLIENGLEDEFSVEDKVAELLEKSDDELVIVKEASQLAIKMSHGSLFDGFDKSASQTNKQKEIFQGIL